MAQEPELELVMLARAAELPGGLHVRRAIPQVQRRMVGPFVFVDQMGPASVPLGQEVLVLPHPHIGLSTVTYLFEGEGLHRDSLGSVQKILPGEVNWMTAGQGIVHSERMQSAATSRMFGIQTWVALPKANEEAPPRFEHTGAEALPLLEDAGVTTRLIAGELFGVKSGVHVSSPLFYAASRLEQGAVLRLTPDYEERAVYVLEGALTLGDTVLTPGEIAFFTRKTEVLLRAEQPSHVLLLGGEPLDGPRFISWNFVSSSKERLQQATRDWHDQRFARVPGETEYLPLPQDGSVPLKYR